MDYRIKVKAYVSIDEIDFQLDTSNIIEVELLISENKWKISHQIVDVYDADRVLSSLALPFLSAKL